MGDLYPTRKQVQPTTDRAVTATDFDERIFPYVFECVDCPHDSTAEIGREEATEAVPPEVEATPRQAVDRALKSRGWWKKGGRLLCPECMADLD